MQEVLARVVPLQEAVARVVAMQEVLARSVAGWWVDCAPGSRGEAGSVIGTSADQEARLYARHQGPCTSLLPLFRRTATRVAYAARRAIWATQRGDEGARTLPQSTASGKPDKLHPGGDKVRSTSLHLAAPPAAAPGMDNLKRVVERSRALVSCLADEWKSLVRWRRFGHGLGVKFKYHNTN